jgi:phosphate transport system substrate-binding protein
MRKLILSLTAFLTLAAPAMAAPVAVDQAITPYKQTSGISGSLSSVGSDTLNNVMTYWAESFKAMYPNVKVQIEGKGSATAPPALIAGTAQIAPMSRLMKASELDEFEKKYGYKPTEIRVAVDALAVFVHKDNPIKSLTLKQADAIFSSTYKQGGTPIKTWGDLGLTGEWATRPISLYGRNSASGTYGYFKDEVLLKGDYNTTVKEQPGSSAVVQGVAGDLGAIGYSGIGYMTSGVKAIPLAKEDGTPYDPSYENCLNGKYPLGRFLYVYVNKKPNAPMDKLTQEFLKFAVSKGGQEVVVKDGYYPLPANIDGEEAKKVN